MTALGTFYRLRSAISDEEDYFLRLESLLRVESDKDKTVYVLRSCMYGTDGRFEGLQQPQEYIKSKLDKEYEPGNYEIKATCHHDDCHAFVEYCQNNIRNLLCGKRD